MAKIYVSSTKADLEEEREAVIDWLVAAGHQPVHSYRPNSETVRNGCLQDIDQCELYVLIAGHRYGYQPDDDNPEKLSITHLEFRRAERIPRVVLMRKHIPNVDLSDIADPDRLQQVMEFRKEVGKAVTAAEFQDKASLIHGVSTGVQAELEKLKPSNQKIVELLLRDNQAKDVRIQELETQLAAAVARTATAAEAPGATPAEVAAFNALKAGDTAPAAVLLRKKEEKEAAAPAASEGESARKLAALAREQGALAMGRDVVTALTAFQRAAEYEPADVWTHFFVGDLQRLLGNLREALNSYHRAAAEAENAWNRNPQDATAERDLLASYDRIGNARVSQGELSAALDAYEKGLAIGKALVERQPANTQGQRDLSVSYERIGDVRVSQGEQAAALEAYEKSLAIRAALAERDPGNPQWQRDLSVSYERIGDVRVSQGERAAALEAYEKSLAIRAALAERDPGNPEWQRDLSGSYNQIGNVQASQGERAGAMEAYEKALAIAKALTVRDTANTEWQRDLSVSYNNVGNLQVSQGKRAAAMEAYEKGLAIRKALAERDPGNAEWQVDLAISYAKLAQAKLDLSPAVRRDYLQRGRAILVDLKEHNRLAANQDWIARFEEQLESLPPEATS